MHVSLNCIPVCKMELPACSCLLVLQFASLVVTSGGLSCCCGSSVVCHVCVPLSGSWLQLFECIATQHSMLCSETNAYRGHLYAAAELLKRVHAELPKCHKHADFPRKCLEAWQHVPEHLHLEIQDFAQAKPGAQIAVGSRLRGCCCGGCSSIYTVSWDC